MHSLSLSLSLSLSRSLAIHNSFSHFLHSKVSSTETGIIFGNIVYEVAGASLDRNCVVLNDIHIDIMDYISPAYCTEKQVISLSLSLSLSLVLSCIFSLYFSLIIRPSVPIPCGHGVSACDDLVAAYAIEV